MTDTTKPTINLSDIVEDAQLAFWAEVVKHLPLAESGDLDPMSSLLTSEKAIIDWWGWNASMHYNLKLPDGKILTEEPRPSGMQTPQTHLEAVTLGIYLALTAPTDKKFRAVVKMTRGLIESVGMSEQDVYTATSNAEAQLGIWPRHSRLTRRIRALLQ